MAVADISFDMGTGDEAVQHAGELAVYKAAALEPNRILNPDKVL
jgi:hypothetical protein